MNWLTDLSQQEKRLKQDFEDLRDVAVREDVVGHDAQQFIRRRIRSRVEEIQHTIDGHRSHRSPDERNVLDYQVDLRLPMYRHLSKLLSLLS